MNGKGAATWGGQLRASVDIFDYLKVEGNVSYDHLFRWVGQGQVSLSIPFGSKKELRNRCITCCKATTLSKRSYQRVDRFEIIPVDRKRISSKATDPSTGRPYFFSFVDNTSHSLGTYESPYNTLATAESNSSSGDIIYIFPGDGTTAGLNSGITLKDYQKLWGSGIAQNLQTTVGNIQIPAHSGGTLNGLVYNPIITNSGTVVTLGNGNEISGLFLQNVSMADAISVTNKTDATLLNSTIAGSNVQGGVGFSASELAGTLTINNCIMNQNNAIELSNSTTNLQANISNSNFAGGDGFTTSSVTWNISDSAQGVLTANNNTFNSSYSAITVTPSGSSAIVATINNNTINGNGNGIYVNGSGTASETLSINGNTITTYNQSIWIAENGALTANIANNTITSTDNYCLEVDTTSGEGLIVMSDNFIDSTDSYALYFNQTGGTLSSTLNGNTIYATDDEYAIYSDLAGSAVNHTLNLNGNTIAGYYAWYVNQGVGNVTSLWNNNNMKCEEYGIYGDQAAGTASLTLNNNTIVAIDDEAGVYWDVYTDATSTNISMTGNEIFANYGVEVYQAVGNLELTLVDNIFQGYNYAGPYLSLSTPGTTTMTMSGNTCTAGEYGVYVDQSAGTFNSTTSNNMITNAASGSTYAGYYYVNSGTANSTQEISGNTITAGPFEVNAIKLSSSSSGTTSFTVTDNILNGGGGSSTGASVLCTMTNGTQSLNLSDNTVTNSGGFSLFGWRRHFSNFGCEWQQLFRIRFKTSHCSCS